MESARNTRHLAAILFTDIVGYIALKQQDETLAIIAVNRHQEVLEDSVAKNNGEVLQYYGDGRWGKCRFVD